MYSLGAFVESTFVFHLHGSVRAPIQCVINPPGMIASQDPVHTHRLYIQMF
jgi:hypothetical protein